jgi:hypothetical protein
MSIESGTSNSFSLFPIGETATKKASVWLQSHTHSPNMLDTEINVLKNSEEDLYFYMSKLGGLRKIVQFDSDNKIERAYWNGSLYMLSALRIQYDNLFKTMPTPSNDTLRTHFFNLLDIELNHGAVKDFAPKIFEPDKEFRDVMSDFMEGYGTDNFDALTTLFSINSQNLVHALFDATPHLENSLVKSSLKQTHGPALGLVYGASDMFELFRIHEEGVAFEEKFAIPTV